MNWFDYLLVAWFALSAFLTIALIGKPRTPTEPLAGAIAVAIQTALIVGLVLTR